MEHIMHTRRIALSGLTMATVLAAGLCAAGPAFAGTSTTPHASPSLPLTAGSPVIPGGPMAYVPGLPNALGAIPATGTPSGTASPLSGTPSQPGGTAGSLPGAGNVLPGAGNVLPGAGNSVPGLGNFGSNPGSA